MATRRAPYQSNASYNSSSSDEVGSSSAQTYTPYSPYPPPARPSLGFPAYLYPTGTHSLAGVAVRAAALGSTLGASFILTILFSTTAVPTYLQFPQLPFFVTLLSLFHILEYWTTAQYNTRHAKISAFLLSSNGAAYNIAHMAAMSEALIEFYLFPQLKSKFTIFTAIGIFLIIVGQTLRTLAMAHAGTNFNHNIQRQRQEGHVLVTTGIYGYLRHPSYFGFFWWGVGTQILLANPICFLGYAVVLWKFFSDRIEAEEVLLTKFFGQDYINYKASTPVGIPLIK